MAKQSLTFLKRVIGLLITAAKSVFSYLSESRATYAFKYDETEVMMLRNDVPVARLLWQDITTAALWQTDAVTTECDNLGLYNNVGKGLSISDFSPSFHPLVDYIDSRFPGFEKIFREYSAHASGKWGDVLPLRIALMLGETPKIISDSVKAQTE
ncbi:MAG: hypothetical protein JNM81_13700 [Rhodospirillaceae bacterium]|nr:hypothetical protein [Rhodospirillaceae bacterium]